MRWPARLRRRKRGAPPRLAGFYGLSEHDYGDATTPEPYLRVTPSRVGPAILPFLCPHCERVNGVFCDPKRRAAYLDDRPGRGHHWCPEADCRKRFYFDPAGMPLDSSLGAGAEYAPSRVEGRGEVRVDGRRPWLKSLLATPRGSFDALLKEES